MISTPSKPASAASSAQRTKSSIVASISASSRARGPRLLIGDGIVDGADRLRHFRIAAGVQDLQQDLGAVLRGPPR